jgi:hypothetical protein
MRASQVRVWTEEIAKSYVNDLRRARAAGRNLMTEKYARMMQSTMPCDCRGIGSVLPELEEPVQRLVDGLTRTSVSWREQVEEAYPHLSGRGRPIRAWEDDRFTTSFETYLRAELGTYSARTLELLDKRYAELRAAGENAAEIILRDTVQRYGFASLQTAEDAARARYNSGSE